MTFFEYAADAVRARRYHAIQSVIPTEERVFAKSGAFSVELPWPWYVFEDPDADPAHGAELVIMAPRTDGRLAFAEFTVEPGQVTLDDSRVNREARAYARQHPGASPLKPRRLLIGGVPGVEFGARGASTENRTLIVPDAERTYRVFVELPASEADGYGLHLDAVYATWLW